MQTASFAAEYQPLSKQVSLLKRGIIGTWHRVSAKHLSAYLDEMTFRFNRRKRSDLFVDTLRHMVTADPLTFQKLTA
jgi:ISXO2-like transposase domain